MRRLAENRSTSGRFKNNSGLKHEKYVEILIKMKKILTEYDDDCHIFFGKHLYTTGCKYHSSIEIDIVVVKNGEIVALGEIKNDAYDVIKMLAQMRRNASLIPTQVDGMSGDIPDCPDEFLPLNVDGHLFPFANTVKLIAIHPSVDDVANPLSVLPADMRNKLNRFIEKSGGVFSERSIERIFNELRQTALKKGYVSFTESCAMIKHHIIVNAVSNVSRVRYILPIVEVDTVRTRIYDCKTYAFKSVECTRILLNTQMARKCMNDPCFEAFYKAMYPFYVIVWV